MRRLGIVIATLFLIAGCKPWGGLWHGYVCDQDPMFDPHPLLYPGLGIQLHPHQTTPQDFALLRELRPQIIRQDIGWAADWPGIGDWDHVDSTVLFAGEIGARVILIMDYRHPDGSYPWATETAWMGWADMLRDAAIRYKGMGIIYEIWNEPNLAQFWPPDGATPDSYAYFFKQSANILHGIDDSACVVGPALAGTDKDWLRELFQTTFLSVADGVSVHPYRSEDPATAADDYEKVYRLMCEEGYVWRPLLASEWGYTKADNSEDLYRAWIAGLHSYVGVLVWYQWRGGDADQGEYALVDNDFQPRPAFFAFKSVIDEIRKEQTP